MEKRIFGKTASLQPVYCYRLYGKENAYAEFLNYGATILSICVPDKNGFLRDVVLGYDDISSYEIQNTYIGATIGRVCNRIENAVFQLENKTYPLFANDGKNHIHGGKIGFDKKIWDAQTDGHSVTFTYISPDQEEGYPGTLKTSVTYTFDESNKLSIYYTATTDKDTLCALTNHAYFNLGGYDSGSISQHILQINADYFTEIDSFSIPHGNICPVSGTPMDFTAPTPIEKNIDSNYEQIQFGHGYDHNWILKHSPDSPVDACVYHTVTGIQMDMTTTLDGVQFYTGNFLDGSMLGKNKTPILRRSGFCLEAQYFPNAISVPNFPKPILKAGEIYQQKTTYQFSVIEK